MQLADLQEGMDIWINQIPFRLIRELNRRTTTSCWLVLPLYVDSPTKPLVIKSTDEFHQARFHGRTG